MRYDIYEVFTFLMEMNVEATGGAFEKSDA